MRHRLPSVKARATLLWLGLSALVLLACGGAAWFGNDAGDYGDGESALVGGEGVADGGLVGRLRRRGFPSVETLPVARYDWLRVLLGLFDEDFRAGKAPPETAFGWYLDRVEELVMRTSAEHGDERVLLLAHSAGGWLARAALSRASVAERTCALVSLGSPHLAPPPEPPGDDQTQGALPHVSKNYPGAFFRERGITYVTVVGSAVIGDEQAERGTPEREAWISYIRLVGRGDVAGDGIVPVAGAHLDGATQITLPGVRHSVGTPAVWYGAEGVIDQWLPQVSACLERQAAQEVPA
eukprot:CAMPEP_0117563756 /NCGR_PEP_ID=MMETSP0784-20121206/55665_1 /TAXON_ID=39447 /ORGANISM="" /LENGTH=295 /DNA_ID=CAMNT_0005361425 /DNA_START=22 /DNA_END=910 /DNA_ORIENTATION=+